MGRVADFIRNLFSPRTRSTGSRPTSSASTSAGAAAEIMDDPYVQNRTNEEQRDRLLDNPAIVHAIGEDAVESTRATLESS